MMKATCTQHRAGTALAIGRSRSARPVARSALVTRAVGEAKQGKVEASATVFTLPPPFEIWIRYLFVSAYLCA
jgi:hypothetical protein